MSRNRILGSLALLLLISTLACSSTKPRLDTDPVDATALFPENDNLSLTTPCDLPDEIDDDDEIIISKQGYRTLRTTLSELPRVADGTYRAKLSPIGGGR
ncbi:MAG: hypothetical protein RL885_15225 [Planctomycetota bacterium]